MHDGSRILLRPAGANTRQKLYAPVRLHACLFLKERVKRILSCVWHLCYVIYLVSPVTYFVLRKEFSLHILSWVWHIPCSLLLSYGTSLTFFCYKCSS